MSPSLFERPVRPPTDPAGAADWWMTKRALELLSPRDEAAFQRWLAEPRNAKAWAAVHSVYEAAGDFAAEPEVLELRAGALKAGPELSRRPLRVAAGIAAALGLGGILIMATLQAIPEAPAPVAQSSAPGNTAAKRYETGVGERREIRLDDGSVVALNTGSVLEIAFSPARRDVRLIRGQALFQVAHDGAWPFVVTAGDRRVTAVGTAFDVRVDGAQVKVVLVEGKVRIDPLQRSGLERLVPQLARETLTPGQQLVAREGAGEVTVATADVQRAVSWRRGQVIFRDDSLAAAAAELNRYSESRILPADQRVAGLKVSGVFNIDRPENFVAAVTAFYPLEAVQSSPGVTELVWRDRR